MCDGKIVTTRDDVARAVVAGEKAARRRDWSRPPAMHSLAEPLLLGSLGRRYNVVLDHGAQVVAVAVDAVLGRHRRAVDVWVRVDGG